MSAKRRFTLAEAIARLYPRLPAETQQALAPLLPRLQEGDPGAQIQALEALRPWPDVGAWLEEMTTPHRAAVENEALMRGYEPPFGTPAVPHITQYWVCPRYEECGEWEPVIQAGEAPPRCPRHDLPMVLHRSSDGESEV